MSLNPIGYLKSQAEEVNADRVLHFVGILLSLIHVYTFFWWRHSLPSYLGTEAAPACWPFLPSCHIGRVLSESGWTYLLWTYLVLAFVAASLFLLRKARSGWWILLALTIWKYLMLLQDMRLMGNYHYMTFVITFAWLLLPQKRVVIPVFLLLCYVAAGLLKVNPEWLSGASLGRMPSFLPDGAVPWLMLYAILLELWIVFGLFAKSDWIRTAVFGQLVLFHLASWFWVGWYYPVNMLTVLAAIAIAWSKGPKPAWRDWLRFAPVTYVAIALFGAVQVVPLLNRRDPALSGDLRIVSLNMYDARTLCFGTILLRYDDRVIEYESTEVTELALRIRCDPSFFIAEARNLCREGAERGDLRRLDLSVISKRLSSSGYKRVLDQTDFCRVDRERGLFHWVLEEPT